MLLANVLRGLQEKYVLDFMTIPIRHLLTEIRTEDDYAGLKALDYDARLEGLIRRLTITTQPRDFYQITMTFAAHPPLELSFGVGYSHWHRLEGIEGSRGRGSKCNSR